MSRSDRILTAVAETGSSLPMLNRLLKKVRGGGLRKESSPTRETKLDFRVPPAVPRHPLWRGSDVRLYERALQLRRELSWVEASFPDPDCEAYYLWLVNFGLRLRPGSIGPYLPRIPSGDRLWAISGSRDVESFLNAGAESAEKIFRILESCGLDPFAPRRVLDFGCGCARVLRHLLPLADRQELWGSDIDEKAIEFCRRSIGRARFVANRSAPPLPFEDGRFDLVYSISVFTHLSRVPFEAWVRELRRVVAPGGRCVVSLHGEHAWKRLNSEPEFRRTMLVDEEELEGAKRDWASAGFAFLTHLVPEHHDDSDPYGLIFVREAALPELWPGFGIEKIERAALSSWQDLVLLKPRGG